MRFSEYKRNYYKVNILTDLKDCYIALSKGHNKHRKMTIEEAVEKTIDECIKEGILADILTKFRAEVKKMSILEYNARLHEETLKKEGYEDGRTQGRAEGRAEGRAVIIQMIHNALSKGHTPEEIVDFMGVSLEDILSVQESMLQEEQRDNL